MKTLKCKCVCVHAPMCIHKKVIRRSCSLSQHSEQQNKTETETEQSPQDPEIPLSAFAWAIPFKNLRVHVVYLFVELHIHSKVITHFISTIDYRAAVSLLKTSQASAYLFDFSQA